MSITQKITCDICGVEKKETNHWYSCAVTPQSCIDIHPLLVNESDFTICCGEACVHKFLAQNLQNLH